jgi:hypothetical protein
MANNQKTVSKETIERVGGEKNLRRLELPTNDLGTENIEIIACVPDRRVMGQYLKYQSTNPAKAQEILVKNCVLTDLEQVLADDGLFLTAFGQIVELIPIREGKIKKY